MAATVLRIKDDPEAGSAWEVATAPANRLAPRTNARVNSVPNNKRSAYRSRLISHVTWHFACSPVKWEAGGIRPRFRAPQQGDAATGVGAGTPHTRTPVLDVGRSVAAFAVF